MFLDGISYKGGKLLETVERDEFVNYLLKVSGCRTITELSKKLGISRVTLNHWSKNNITKMAPATRKKLQTAFEENPSWGIKLGSINNSKIEIITSGRDTSDSMKNKNEDSLITEILKENFQLRKENSILKEKIEKYEVKK